MTVLAHGVGGSTDLPVPLSYALIGAAWALAATFAVVAVAWRTPRFDPAKPGRELPAWVTAAVDSPVVRWIVATAAAIFSIWVAVAAIWGPQDSDSALPGVFYVLLWVGLVAISVVVGPIWRVISPVRTAWRLVQVGRRDPTPSQGRVRYRPGWGYWPAVVGLFAFVWLELASSDPGSLTAIKIWILIYARRNDAWRSILWDDVVRPSRPVRGVQRDRLAAGTFSEKSRDRTHRARESTRSSAHHAGAARHRSGDGGASGIHRVRQLLPVRNLQQLRQSQRRQPSLSSVTPRAARCCDPSGSYFSCLQSA